MLKSVEYRRILFIWSFVESTADKDSPTPADNLRSQPVCSMAPENQFAPKTLHSRGSTPRGPGTFAFYHRAQAERNPPPVCSNDANLRQNFLSTFVFLFFVKIRVPC